MNKKSYILLIIMILVFVSLIFVLNNKKAYIILADKNIYTYSGGKLKNVESDIKNNNIVVSSDILENYKFNYKNKKLSFYKGKRHVNIDDFKYAYTSSLKIDELSIHESEISPDEYETIKKVLNNHNIDGYSNLYTSDKIKIDDKTIYLISNLFEEFTYDKVFSFVYYINDKGDIIYLDEQVTDSVNSYDLCVPRFNSVIKINDKANLIIDCEYFSNLGVKSKMYEITKNEFKLLN